MHLATHSDRVVATDVNQRALAIARFNVALNDVDDKVEVRDGSFFAPVAGQTFDLIATNPPFVISPATGERLVYRDSGLPGDQVVEHIVRTAPRHLNEGGWCQVLANWVIDRDQPWDERLAGWLPEECDALVVQREVLDPASYVEPVAQGRGSPPGDRRRPRGVRPALRHLALLAGGAAGRRDRLRVDQPAPHGRAHARPPGVALRRRAAHRAGDLRVGGGRDRGRLGRPGDAPGAARGRRPGDLRPRRRRGPVGDRAAPAARLPPRPAGRHGHGRRGRRLRR
ncbi:methyltransferase [Nocardioides convexus]|uniref:methyltransferase n=1 Tax=Nocardioides convexus TaxID=2712224 RepID=UPI00241814AF|nr:methyltransferase [Nocardioides convexus]